MRLLIIITALAIGGCGVPMEAHYFRGHASTFWETGNSGNPGYETDGFVIHLHPKVLVERNIKLESVEKLETDKKANEPLQIGVYIHSDTKSITFDLSHISVVPANSNKRIAPLKIFEKQPWEPNYLPKEILGGSSLVQFSGTKFYSLEYPMNEWSFDTFNLQFGIITVGDKKLSVPAIHYVMEQNNYRAIW